MYIVVVFSYYYAHFTSSNSKVACVEPLKAVNISEVKVRQKGLGYASSVGLEFEIAKDFAKQLHSANKEEYPPEPEISDKEKRRLGVN